MKHVIANALTITIAMLAAVSPLRAEPPKILQFRVQEVNQKTYFHLRAAAAGDSTIKVEKPK